MLRTTKLFIGVGILAVGLCATAFADTQTGQTNQTTIVSVQGNLANTVSSATNLSSVGTAAYNTQETVYGVVSNTASLLGIKTTHSYVDVKVGDATVPVDPMRPGD